MDNLHIDRASAVAFSDAPKTLIITEINDAGKTYLHVKAGDRNVTYIVDDSAASRNGEYAKVVIARRVEPEYKVLSSRDKAELTSAKESAQREVARLSRLIDGPAI